MGKLLLMLEAMLCLVHCAERRVTVKDFACGSTYNAEDDNLHFMYHGAKLREECIFTVKKYSEKYKQICAVFDKAWLRSCHTIVEFQPSANTVKVHMCETSGYQEYCKEIEKLKIVFKANISNTDEVDLRVFYKEAESGAATVGIVVACIVLSILFVIAVVIVYVNRRKRAFK